MLVPDFLRCLYECWDCCSQSEMCPESQRSQVSGIFRWGCSLNSFVFVFFIVFFVGQAFPILWRKYRASTNLSQMVKNWSSRGLSFLSRKLKSKYALNTWGASEKVRGTQVRTSKGWGCGGLCQRKQKLNNASLESKKFTSTEVVWVVLLPARPPLLCWRMPARNPPHQPSWRRSTPSPHPTPQPGCLPAWLCSVDPFQNDFVKFTIPNWFWENLCILPSHSS